MQNSAQKLVLFDIDSTLVKHTEGHKASFSAAFKEVYGIDTSMGVINYHGMTDQQIIIGVLKKNGLDEEAIKSKLALCMKSMVRHYNEMLPKEHVTVFEGVKELLEALSKRGAMLGLVTGNLEEIARGKLKKAGILEYFRIGGFGSDDANRTNLLKIAISRAQEKYGFSFGNDNIFLVGDAPNDINAGKEAGITTIGVATGTYSLKALENSGADFVFDNLKNTKEIAGIILQNSADRLLS